MRASGRGRYEGKLLVVIKSRLLRAALRDLAREHDLLG